MEPKRRYYLKLNLVLLFCLAVSFISISFAWFAFSGLSRMSTEIDVKTWFIEFQKDNQPVSNNIVLSLSDIYPGMDTVHESVKIMNKGDSDAQLSYSIVSASILDENLDSQDSTEYIEDKISHDYPFKININLSKKFALAGGDYSLFDLSVSWPLDSGNDNLDSDWGNKAYLFQQNEQSRVANEAGYNAKPSIKVVLSVKAEQYLRTDDSSDIDYEMGNLVLYDVANNSKCDEIGGTCIRTHVIDVDNKVGDDTLTLLPDLFGSYASGSYDEFDTLFTNSDWQVDTRPLVIDDLLNIVSSDVLNSSVVNDYISDSLIGDVRYNDRINKIVDNTININGYFRFMNEKFSYLASSKCFWVRNDYGSDKAFALTRVDDTYSKIYGENKSNSCSVVPVIIAPKSKLI